MADERIDIEITDKVSGSVKTSILEIAEAARTSHSALEKLRGELRSLENASGLTKLANEQAKLTNAQARQTSATARLKNAEARTQAQLDKSALSQQKLATETQKTAQAEARAATARAQQEAATTRAAAAALRLQQAQERATRQARTLEGDAEKLKRTVDSNYASQVKYNQTLSEARRLWKAGAIDVNTYADAVSHANRQVNNGTTGFNRATNNVKDFGKSNQVARHHLLNLGFQIQDIGVSLASGQNPLVVLVQQGAQIAGIMGQAQIGVRGLAVAVGGLLAPFAPFVALIGVGFAGLKTLTAEINKNTGSLEGYARSLGATSDQLEDVNLKTVTFGDTLKGFFVTLNQYTGVGDFFSKLWEDISNGFRQLLINTGREFSAIIAFAKASYETVIAIWETFPQRFLAPINRGLNSAIDGFEGFTNVAISGLNEVIGAMNAISVFEDIPLLENVNFGQLNTDFGDAGKDLGTIFKENYEKSFADSQAAINQFMADWAANSVKAAKDRIKKEIGDGELNSIFDRLYKEVTGPQRELNLTRQAANKLLASGIIDQARFNAIMERARDTYQSAVNPIHEFTKSSQEQLRVSSLLGEAQEIETKVIDQRNKALQMGIPFTQEMADKVRELAVATNEAEKRSKFLNELFVEREQRLRDVSAEQNYLNEAFHAGAINAEMYQSAIAQLNVEAANLRLQLGGQEWADAFLVGLGRVVEGYQGALPEMANAFGNLFDTITTGFADSIGQAIVYGDNLGESLRNVARSALSELISTIIKMGIQWAVTQALQTAAATTALATQTAASTAAAATVASAWATPAALVSLASFGSNSIPASAGIVATTSLAQGLAAVPGFEEGGFTGNLGRKEIAGVVHGQEYVMNAGATARIGVSNLEALASGAAKVQTADTASNPANKNDTTDASGQSVEGGKSPVTLKQINVLDPALVGDYLDSPDSDEVFINKISRNSESIKSFLG